ncbi:RidA family protein [Candidatus Saccharibacteria bacterium]|nr:RidA family protein [Candidatus Saccharibacteria bacterium]
MKHQVVTANTKSAHLLSQGISAGGFIFVSGQVHAGSDMVLSQGTTADKVELIMKNIAEVLTAAGARLDDIVKVIIYVTDMALMPEINAVYPTYFQDSLPVREAVCVAALPLGASIEMSVIAVQN